MHEKIDPESCIFCKIVSKQAPAHVVWEDERTLAFMDAFPVADGHTLVIPKAHCSNLLDAEEEDLRAVIAEPLSAGRSRQHPGQVNHRHAVLHHCQNLTHQGDFHGIPLTGCRSVFLTGTQARRSASGRFVSIIKACTWTEHIG